MITNIVLLATSLLTNTQSAITVRTNNAALLTHVQTVTRVDVIGLKHGRKTVPYQTNQVQISRTQSSEVVPDLSPSVPAVHPPTTASSVTKPVVKPSIPRAPNTNSPALKRPATLPTKPKPPLPVK